MHGIEDIMVMGNVVTATALEQALQRREHHGFSLAVNLVFTGAIDDRALAVFYQNLLGFPLAHEEDLKRISRETFSLIPTPWVYRDGVLPLYRERVVLEDDSIVRRLVIAVVDPTDNDVLRNIQEHVGLHLNVHILNVGQMARHYTRLTGKDWELDWESVRSLRTMANLPTAAPDPNFTHQWMLTAETVESFSPSLSHLVDRAHDLDAELDSLFDDDDLSEDAHEEEDPAPQEPPNPRRTGQNRWFLDPVKSGEVRVSGSEAEAPASDSLGVDSIVVDTDLSPEVEEVVLLTDVKPEPVLERLTPEEEEQAIEISLDFDDTGEDLHDLSDLSPPAGLGAIPTDLMSEDPFDIEISLDDLSFDFAENPSLDSQQGEPQSQDFEQGSASVDEEHAPSEPVQPPPAPVQPPPIPQKSTALESKSAEDVPASVPDLASAPSVPSSTSVRTTLQGLPIIRPIGSGYAQAKLSKADNGEFSEPSFPVPKPSADPPASAISSGSHAALVSLVMEAQPSLSSDAPRMLSTSEEAETVDLEARGREGALSSSQENRLSSDLRLGQEQGDRFHRSVPSDASTPQQPTPALSRQSGLFKFPQRASVHGPPSFPTPQRPTPVLRRPPRREQSAEFPVLLDPNTEEASTPQTSSEAVRYFAGQVDAYDSGTFRPSLQAPEDPSDDSAFLQSVEDALSSAVLLARRKEEEERTQEGLVFDLPIHVAPSIRVRWEPLLRGFEHAKERDEVGFIAAGVLLSLHQRVVLLSLRSSGAAVWMVARNRGASVERSSVSFPLSSVFCLHRCAMNQTCFLGPALDLKNLSQDPAQIQGRQAWFDLLPGALPTTALVFPVLLLGKVVALVYCDDGPEQTTVADREGLALIRECMEHSFQRIIRERKKRRSKS